MKTLRYDDDGVSTVKGISTATLVEDDDVGLWVGEIYGRTGEECRERADRIIASVAACSALPDPERDVRDLLTALKRATLPLMAAAGYGTDVGLSREATAAAKASADECRALLARINPEPAQ